MIETMIGRSQKQQKKQQQQQRQLQNVANSNER